MAASDVPTGVLEPKGTPGRRLTILSIDGGGVRGVIPAICIEFMEAQLQALDGPQARIADYFDVVAGTSTGALIAAMLTAPDANKRPLLTATQAKNFYLDEAATIFPKPLGGCSPLSGLVSPVTGLVGPKYSAPPMKKLLVETFKDSKMADAVTDLLITSFDVKTQQPVFFNKQVASRVPRFNATISDVCLGTTAAPTFFPAQKFSVADPDSGPGKTHEYNLIDGAVAANNPTEVAILHTLKDLCAGKSPHQGRIPCFSGYKDLLVISLGTGEQTVSFDAADVAKWGALSWVTKDGQTPIVTMLQNSSGYLVDYDLSIRFQVGNDSANYLRLQTYEIEGDLAAVDGASKKNMQNLVNLANELLDEQAKYRDAVNGELVDKTYFGTNKDALKTFAGWLSIEKKARAALPPAQQSTPANGVSASAGFV